MSLLKGKFFFYITLNFGVVIHCSGLFDLWDSSSQAGEFGIEGIEMDRVFHYHHVIIYLFWHVFNISFKALNNICMTVCDQNLFFVLF